MTVFYWLRAARAALSVYRMAGRPRRTLPRRLTLSSRPGLELLEDRNLLSFVGFAPPLYYPLNNTGQSGPAPVTADLNGDGKLDLVAANNATNSISVLLGNGDGIFQSPQSFPTGAGFATAGLAVGDFNGVGTPDLAAITYANTVTVLLGNGNGTFQAPRSTILPVGYIPSQVVATDLEGDGKQDDLVVMTGTAFTQSVIVLQGNGDGTFHATQIITQSNFSPRPGFVTVADFNGDGRPDLAITNPLLSTVSVLLGNGDGTFRNGQTYSIQVGGPVPVAVVAGDFTGSGKADLVVSDRNPDPFFFNGGISVLLGNGDGTFQPPQYYPESTPATFTTVADFANDGNLSLAGASFSGALTVLLGNGDGTFQAPQSFCVNGGLFNLATGDFNGDGRPDVAATQYGTVTVLLNQLPFSAAAVNFSATAGAPFSGPVATFTNPLPALTAASYTATIDWGDGNVSTGTVSGNGTLTVSGSNTYAEVGSDAVTVSIRSTSTALPAAAIVYPTATVTNLGQSVQNGLEGGIGLWDNKNGQALINGFNGGPNSTALSTWLATNFGNLYGLGSVTDLTGFTNSQVAAFYQSQFALPGALEAQVLATALNIYATTLSFGGTLGQAYGFTVSADGLGAYSYNVGADGAAFGVADNTTLSVYALMEGVNEANSNNNSTLLYSFDRTLSKEASDLFSALMQAGAIAS